MGLEKCKNLSMVEFRRVALYSDLDGTAVVKLSNRHPWRWPQNLAKYPLAIIPGWGEFIHGALEVEGVHFRGIVSRRPNILPRRKATSLSLAKTALDPDFLGRESLAGSEEAKAKVLTDAAQENLARVAVAMIDDMPHKLVPNIITELDAVGLYLDLHLPQPKITVGVVNHPKSMSRIKMLAEEIESMEANDTRKWDGFYHGVHVEPTEEGGLQIGSGKMDIDVVPLPPYSRAAGIEFGERLVTTPLRPPEPTY